MEVWINYIASVFFACVGLILIGAYAIVTGDVTALRVIVLSAGFAWASCYLGAGYFVSGEAWLRYVSCILLVLALLLVATVVLVRL